MLEYYQRILQKIKDFSWPKQHPPSPKKDISGREYVIDLFQQYIIDAIEQTQPEFIIIPIITIAFVIIMFLLFRDKKKSTKKQNFQNQPEKYSESMDVEVWLLKLKKYLHANPHLNKKHTLKCLLDDKALALVELFGTQGKSFGDLTKIVKFLFEKNLHKSENVAKEEFYERIQLPNESYLKYRIELTKLANDAFSKSLMPSAIEKTIRVQFINGLRNHIISDACRMDVTEDFDVLIEKIKCMEEALM
jgi:hypothetical protein